jgi:glycosyltransferase involved in cell wall biosynthesis
MNILYICEEYPPGRHGGIGSMVRQLAVSMVSAGHQVYVIGLYPQGYGQADYEEQEGVKIWRLRYHTDIGLFRNNFSFTDNLLHKLLRWSFLQQWDTSRSVKKLFDHIAALVATHGIDVIEIPDWNTFLHHSRTIIPLPDFGVPIVVKCHGSHSYLRTEMQLPVNRRIFKAEQLLLSRATALAAVSAYAARQTRQVFGLTRAITVLYNGVAIPVKAARIRQESSVVFTGALSKGKGVHALLNAWTLVHQRYPDAILHLYGKGPVRQLKKMPDAAALNSIVFHGHVAREVLFQALSEATFAIFPSYTECFAIAPLEAMAQGCAVIYTERSSGPELITHGQNGLLVDPDNTDAIADAIGVLLRDREKREQLAMAGFQTVQERFSIDTVVQQHIAFYRQVIEAGER